MTLIVLLAVACAIMFYRAADYERLSGWVWATASFATFLIAGFVSSSIWVALALQAALFVLMWVYNAKRHGRHSGS